MSLPTQVSNVEFVIDPAGTPTTHELIVSNLRIPTSMEFWDGRQGLSVGGYRRRKKIVRGFDRKLTFDWQDIRNQETEVLAFLDDLKTASDNEDRIRFNVKGETDYIYVVPDEATYNQNYKNQIKTTPTTMSFNMEQIRDATDYD